MFFKIGVLKNFETFTGKHLCWPLQAFFYRTPTVAASGFSRKQFFQLNLVFIADSCTGFFSELLYKQELNLRSSHWNSSVKKGVLRNFANFTGKQFRPAALLKRGSNKGVLQWNLQNFWEHLIWGLQTTASETCSFTRTGPFK